MASLNVLPVFFNLDYEEARARLEAVRESVPQHAKLIEECLLADESNLAELRRRAVDADVVLELTGGALYTTAIRFFLRLGDLGLPLILCGDETRPGARRLEAAGYWRARGLAVTLPLTRAELSERLILLAAKRRIEETGAIIIGSRGNSRNVVTSSADLEAPRRALGMWVRACGFEELRQSCEASTARAVEEMAAGWRRGADRLEGTDDEALRWAARYYLGLKKVLTAHSADALALNCLPVVEERRGTPCLALVRLNDEGVPAACDADLTALITMIFLERLAEAPVFMGNIISADPGENTIELGHCVLPLCLHGYGQAPRPYVLHDYHDGGFGATAAYEPEMDRQVTIARFDAAFGELVYTRGVVKGCRQDFCRSNLRLGVPDAGEIIRRASGNHHIMAYGDHTGRLRALCREYGIAAVCAEGGGA